MNRILTALSMLLLASVATGATVPRKMDIEGLRKGPATGVAPSAGYDGYSTSCAWAGATGLFGTAYATPTDGDWTSIGSSKTVNKGTYLITFAASFDLGADNATGTILAYFRIKDTTSNVEVARSDYAPLGYRRPTDTIGDVYFSRPTFAVPYTVSVDSTVIRFQGVLDTTNGSNETGLTTSVVYSSGGYFCLIQLN